MKTPIQELIEQLNNVKPQDFCSIETIKGWAEELREEENEVITDAYEVGRVDNIMYDNYEDYYNETFNTKEK